MKKFVPLTTERVLLRALVPGDAAAIHALRSNETVNRYLDRDPSQSIDMASAFIEKIIDGIKNNHSFYWGIATKSNPAEVIGTICLWNFTEDGTTAEIGYELLPTFGGKGYMQEAVDAVLKFAFDDLALRTVLAFTRTENEASTRLLKKFSFQPSPGPVEASPNESVWILQRSTS